MKKYFFSQEERLYLFTERLSDLLAGGLSVQKSLFVLMNFSWQDKKFQDTAADLYNSLAQGRKFSAALKLSMFTKAPDWYFTFISLAEESNCLCEVLSHVKKVLYHKRQCRKKIFSLMLYPFFLILLTAVTGSIFVFHFLPVFSFLFGEEGPAILSASKKSLMLANLFLLFFLFFLLFFLKRNFSSSLCTQLFKSMAFLTENKIPTLRLLSSAISFASADRRVSQALIQVKNQILEGRSLSSSFAMAFEKFGLKEEGILISENLSICQETGKNNAYEKTYCYLAEKDKNMEKNILSLIQPLMILVTAIYLSIILRTAFMPLISDFGGLI